MNNIESNLSNVCKKCDIILLETEVCDSLDSDVIKTTENGYDQAFHHVGSRPSQTFIENLLVHNEFSFKMIKDPILNSSFHKYDWETMNTKNWEHGL